MAARWLRLDWPFIKIEWSMRMCMTTCSYIAQRESCEPLLIYQKEDTLAPFPSYPSHEYYSLGSYSDQSPSTFSTITSLAGLTPSLKQSSQVKSTYINPNPRLRHKLLRQPTQIRPQRTSTLPTKPMRMLLTGSEILFPPFQTFLLPLNILRQRMDWQNPVSDAV